MKTSIPAVLLALLLALQAEGGGRRALLIGIDDYSASRLGRPGVAPPPDRDWADLAGPVNDAGILRQMLVLRHGFAENDIVTLTDQQATRHAILAAIENHLVKAAAKGDTVVFYFAGHGSQVRNSLSDEADRLDESLVPADSRLGARDIRDKELRRLFNAVLDRGARLTVILDNCHSGSGARGLPAGRRARAVKPDRRDIADGSRMPPRPEERGALVLAATQDFDQAWETRDIDGEFHGVFSWALFRAMRDASADESASDTFVRARARMRAETPLQEPVMSGTAEARHAPLFSVGGQRRSARPVASVERVLPDGTVLLQGGWANGLSVGTELRVVGERLPAAGLRVVEMLGLGRSRARVGAGRTLPQAVRSGALLEVAAWAAPPGRPLHIWMPRASGDASAVAALGRRLHAGAKRRGIAWISDPTESTPSYLLRHGQQGWELLASGKVTGRLGTNPDDVIAALARVPRRTSLFVQLPAPAAVADAIAAGAVRDGIVSASGPEDADYILLARYSGGRAQYAWVRPGVTAADRRRTGLPLRSDWFMEEDGDALRGVTATLRDAVLRLRRIHAWNLLESPPGQRSPYRLALCHARSGETATEALTGDQTYEIVLRRPHGPGPRKQQRYAYVFVVDSHGTSTLLFPEGGSVENRVPPSLPAPREIRLGNGSSFVVGPPYGVDTFFLLTTDEALPNPWVLEWDGVRTRSPELPTPLEQLFLLTHSGTRAGSLVTPATWSIERAVLESVPAPRRRTPP